MNQDRISEALKRNGIPYTPELPEKLEVYLDLLQEWNARMDLTSVAEADEDPGMECPDGSYLRSGSGRSD